MQLVDLKSQIQHMKNIFRLSVLSVFILSAFNSTAQWQTTNGAIRDVNDLSLIDYFHVTIEGGNEFNDQIFYNRY